MPSTPEGHKPSKKEQKIEEGRAVSDTQAVRKGAEIKAGGRIEFTEKQIAEARERMERELAPYETLKEIYLQLESIDGSIRSSQATIKGWGKRSSEIDYTNNSDHGKQLAGERTYEISQHQFREKDYIEKKEKEKTQLLELEKEVWPKLNLDAADFKEKLGALSAEEEVLGQEYTKLSKAEWRGDPNAYDAGSQYSDFTHRTSSRQWAIDTRRSQINTERRIIQKIMDKLELKKPAK